MRQRTASAPSSAACWKAAWKAPGEGAAVAGRSPLPRQRSQNSAGVSWRRSSSSSSPKRMVSGTTMTLCSLTSWSVRSQALSVTMWTPGMQRSLPRCGAGRPVRRGRGVVVVECGSRGVRGPPGRSARPRARWRRVQRGCDASGGARREEGTDGSHGALAPPGLVVRPGRVGSRSGPSGSGRTAGRRARPGATGRPARLVAPAQPDHDGAEGEAAGDHGADDTGQEAGDAGRRREVGHHEDHDAPWARRPRRRGRSGAHDARARPAARTTGGTRRAPAARPRCRRSTATARGRARRAGGRAARARTMLSAFSTR